MSAAAEPALDTVRAQAGRLEAEVRKRIVGMDEPLRMSLLCLFAGGHVLLEGVPGLAKTLFFKTLAEACQVEFRRISFAADLLPKDVVGIEHFDPASGKVELVVKGPLHTNFLLTDELNRARTTSKGSVLEPMEEGQVTTELGGTYRLSPLFMVVATQNPVEEEGTFGLGRAERDRFLMKVPIGYPSAGEEREILRRYGVDGTAAAVDAVIDEAGVLAARRAIAAQVHVADGIVAGVQRMLDETRPERSTVADVIELVEPGGGASPRAGIGLIQAARVHAVLQGRDHVAPDDLVAVIVPVMRHRIVFRPGEVPEEQAERHLVDIVDDVIRKVL